MQTILAGLRAHFGMEVAFVSQFVEGDRVFRYVDSAVADCPVRVDSGDPIEESYCGRVVSGLLPSVLQDAARHPVAAALPVTRALPVGAHISVPIVLSDQSVFGTLCAFRSTPDFSLDDSAAHLLRAAAVVIGLLLEAEEADRRAAVELENKIDQILAASGPIMFFQPIIDLASKEVVGYEALARFPDSRPPDRWFAEAWAAERGIELELSALQAALRDFPRLGSDGFLAVNLSATTCSDEAVLDLLLANNPGTLVVEITEHAAIDNVQALIEHLQPFREQGGRLAIDDVGTGFSGLSQIVALSPEVIKLDRSLIVGIDTDRSRAAMAASLVGYSANVGATLLAEGIEDSITSQALADLGVSLAQGYYHGPPAPSPDPAAPETLPPHRHSPSDAAGTTTAMSGQSAGPQDNDHASSLRAQAHLRWPHDGPA